MNMIDIDTSNLLPKDYRLSNGNVLHTFFSDSVELVKFDFSFEAGSVYQPKLLCAAATINLIGEGTAKHSAQEIAEFMDYRGIVIERASDITTPCVTVYTLRKFVPELLPWVKEMLSESTFPQDEFDIYVHKRKRQLMAQRQKTSAVAMTEAYEALFGKDHCLGQYALPEDYDNLSVDAVRAFYRDFFRLGGAHLMISGNFDQEILEQYDALFGQEPVVAVQPSSLAVDQPRKAEVRRVAMPGAVQSSLRIGRILPMRWDSMEYAEFMVLSTVLGGYMGSRLMSSVREEKGYTYGISSHTHIYRDTTLFFITTDVGGQYTDAAVEEIFSQIELLRNEPIAQEEIDLVRHVMEGDFIRSIDGIFERSERYRQMFTTGVNEQFRLNYFGALKNITPQRLQALADKYLRREELAVTAVGTVDNSL